MNTPRMHSYPEVAAATGTSVRTLSRLVASGAVTRYRSTRDRRRILLDLEEVAAALADHAPEVAP